MDITEFGGGYRFLSNFYPADVWLDYELYPSVEHAYQAAKTSDLDQRKVIRDLKTPGDAKRLGRRIPLREDWEDVKLQIMYNLVWRKFKHHPELGQKLLGTGDVQLVEGNRWGDTFWGTCLGKGENHLGKILMMVRYELREEG